MWVSGSCVLGPWPTSHWGLPGHQDSSDSPLLLPTTMSLSIPGTDISDANPSPSPHNTSMLLITLQISRDRTGFYHGCRQPGMESMNISRGYCRGRTVSLQQNIKDKQSKSLESPLGALWVEVTRLWFQIAPHIQDICMSGCTPLPARLEWHHGCILKSA